MGHFDPPALAIDCGPRTEDLRGLRTEDFAASGLSAIDDRRLSED